MKIFLILLFPLLSHIPEARASFFSTFQRDITSPFNSSMVYFFAGGTVTSLGIKYFGDEQIVQPIQREMTRKNHLGNFNEPLDYMGQLIPNAIYIAGFGIHAALTDDQGSQDNATIMFKSMFYSCLMSTVLKYSFQEERPNGASNLSFPSGHTTAAFAFASVVGARHPWYFGVPAYILATLVGIQRLNSNSHFIHDVLMGATIGISYGISLSDVDSEIALIPILDGQRVGMFFRRDF